MGRLVYRTHSNKAKKVGSSLYAKARYEGTAYTGGNFTASDPDATISTNLISLYTDGRVNTTLNVGIGFNENDVNAIAVQSDGKIIVGGDFTSYNENTKNCIVRLNTNGSIDTNFSIGTGFSTEVFDIKIQNDGKILVCGSFSSYNSTNSRRIIRLNSDGTIDNSFSVGTGFSSAYAYKLFLQNDNKIIVVGAFTSYNSTTSNYIIRLNSDGSIDTNFNIGTGFNFNTYAIAIQNDDKIVIGGAFTSYNGNSYTRIIRLNRDGSLDSSFDDAGDTINDAVFDIAIQSDGKILVGGGFTNFITRLNTDGSIDTSFTNNRPLLNSSVQTIILQQDGKILLGGNFSFVGDSNTKCICRLNTNGSLDTSFGTGLGFSGSSPYINKLFINSNNEILVGGKFFFYQGTKSQYIVGLKTFPNFNIDTNFNTGTGFNTYPDDMATQIDNKILVCGNFTSYNSSSINRIIRLNTDGTKDSTFSIGTGFNNRAKAIAIQSDGKVLVGGSFTSYNGNNRNGIIRLNDDGAVDTGFSVGTGFSSTSINKIIIQDDDKILIGGDFTSYDGNTKNHIVRLNTNGSIDTNFNIGTGFDGYVSNIFIQNDNKIVVVGAFTSYDGNTRNRIIRLNNDGTIDNTFSIGTGFNNVVYTSSIQDDGKILLGGVFSTYNATTTNYIVRLNSDGSLDTSFNIGTGFDGSVRFIKYQPDGKVLVGGNFKKYNTTTGISCFIILNYDGSFNSSFDFNGEIYSIAIN